VTVFLNSNSLVVDTSIFHVVQSTQHMYHCYDTVLIDAELVLNDGYYLHVSPCCCVVGCTDTVEVVVCKSHGGLVHMFLGAVQC